MLLYLVKHLRCKIADAVRELSKVIDGANMTACKEMHQVIKYVLDARDLGLWIEPIQRIEQSWELVCVCDSDYAGDPDFEEVFLSLYIMFVEYQPVGGPRLSAV